MVKPAPGGIGLASERNCAAVMPVHARFEWVLLYQAKPNALAFDTTLRDIHLKLNAELGRYHKHVRFCPADKIYRAADTELTGSERLDSPHPQPRPRPP
jgi:hypothetical protein